ncbi:hypothetical protein C2G38_2164307 [Gigaspora rosea]|uniref:Uncharacterized protein n=1 Tax=Gigaspora rosea TaxID=44941 RepID=A0A397VU54_9GLOM|nr:hypothetical protein C2G38_2164307 [Gigaspora rosea]
MESNTNSKASDEPTNHTAITIDISKIDGNTKATEISTPATQTTRKSSAQPRPGYYNTTTKTPLLASHNHNFHATTTQPKEKQVEQEGPSRERLLMNSEEYLDNIGLMREDTDIEDVESSVLADNTESLNGCEISLQSSKPGNQILSKNSQVTSSFLLHQQSNL